MEQGRFEELTEIMARLAGGDDAATWTLFDQFGAPIAAAMRGHVRRMGLAEVSRDDLEGLVADACMAIRDVAGTWSPDGGAAPWHYARGRLADIARVFVGQHAAELDEARLAGVEWGALSGPPAVTADEPPVAELMARIVSSHQRAELLVEACAAVKVSERDQLLLWEHEWQRAEGDASPASTIARAHGLSHDAMRQVVSRSKRKLRALVARDERYGPLADLPFLAA